MLPDMIGWIGNIGFIIGVLLIAKQNIYGFHACVFGNLMYFIQAYFTGMWSLGILSIYLIAVNLYGIRNWQNKAKDNPTQIAEDDQHTLLAIKSLLNYITYFVHEEDRKFVDDYHTVCRKYCSWGKPENKE
jgi:nicotinamide riboside transporter PnuC